MLPISTILIFLSNVLVLQSENLKQKAHPRGVLYPVWCQDRTDAVLADAIKIPKGLLVLCSRLFSVIIYDMALKETYLVRGSQLKKIF